MSRGEGRSGDLRPEPGCPHSGVTSASVLKRGRRGSQRDEMGIMVRDDGREKQGDEGEGS